MATKLMIIRHAEKPPDDGSVLGVSEDGKHDPEELVVRGWQRAGALASLFAPIGNRFVDPNLATPDVIYASGIGKHSNSLRPQHTVSVLAELLRKSPVMRHLKGDETALVADVTNCKGCVLIAWEHEAIPTIAQLILGANNNIPKKWPDSRFDLVWIFDRSDGFAKWNFKQVPQMLLPNDRPDPIGLS